MNRLTISVLATLAVCVSACSTRHQSAGDTYTLMVEDIALSARKPTAQLGKYTIKLVSIADDGTTQIKVLQTRKVLSAVPGKCFISYEFGQEGLELLSASSATGTAKMISRGCMRH